MLNKCQRSCVLQVLKKVATRLLSRGRVNEGAILGVRKQLLHDDNIGSFEDQVHRGFQCEKF